MWISHDTSKAIDWETRKKTGVQVKPPTPPPYQYRLSVSNFRDQPLFILKFSH